MTGLGDIRRYPNEAGEIIRLVRSVKCPAEKVQQCTYTSANFPDVKVGEG